MFFPIYVVDKIEIQKPEEIKTLFLDGRTRIRGCLFSSDFGIKLGKDTVTCDIEPGHDKEKVNRLIDKSPDGLNLFVQYRHELFWLMGIKKEHIYPCPFAGYIRIVLPYSQAIISELE